MAPTINLHGGPMDGQQVALPDDRDVFFIKGIDEDAVKVSMTSEEPALAFVKSKTGTYSRVRHSFTEFEWDGWQKP